MKRLKTILQSKLLIRITCIICICYSILLATYFEKNKDLKTTSIEIEGKLIEYKIDEQKLQLLIKDKEKIIANYYFNSETEQAKYKELIELGLILKIRGMLKIPSNNTVPNSFNYKNYLKYKNINYYIDVKNIEIVKNNTSVFYLIKNKLINRIDKIDRTGYLRTFVVGDKSLINDQILNIYQDNGISHLFSISGMHVSLIVGVLMNFLNKISYNNYYKYSIVILFLIFYAFLTNFSASILRTVIMFIIFSINKLFNLKIKKLDLMLIVLIIAILLNPFIIFDMGFQFSYIISFFLMIFQPKISNFKCKWQQSLITTIISFLISMPICLYYYSSINVLSIFLNLIMIPIVSIFIFPLSLLTLIFPIIYPFFEISLNILEKINILANKIDVLKLILYKPPIFLILIYYIVIFLTLSNKRFSILLLILFITHKSYPYMDSQYIITFLEVGQGDSLFIKFPNNKGNILIDSGGLQSFSKKLSSPKNTIITNKTAPFLKSLGIKKLDYLMISHGDYDHMGESINLVENFKVEKVIFNCGGFNELEQNLIKVLDKKKIPYYSCIKELNIDDNKLYFLNNKDYGNENDNSNVIYTELNNYKFLFMGDAGVEVEEDLIEKYNLKDIDLLKVGHHGSKTSSSQKFIDKINPKYSIISVGKNNRYGHPNKEVLNNLGDSKIYRTDIDGSIMFKIKNNKLKIETCNP